MNKNSLITLIALLIILIVVIFYKFNGNRTILVINNSEYQLEYDEYWKWSDERKKLVTSAQYVGSLSNLEDGIFIRIYKVDKKLMSDWIDYIKEIQNDEENSMLVNKEEIAVNGFMTDIWFIANSECCERQWETTLSLYNDDLIFFQMEVDKEDYKDEVAKEKFFKILRSFKRLHKI